MQALVISRTKRYLDPDFAELAAFGGKLRYGQCLFILFDSLLEGGLEGGCGIRLL